MVVYSDSDWAGDKEDHSSVSGYVIFPCGCAHHVEIEEYFALSEAAKDVNFFTVIQSLGIKVVTPIIIKVDNIGAIFMAENASATCRTKHFDMHYHFV
jgi:hypothetical protein